jgi:hypothetical protein
MKADAIDGPFGSSFDGDGIVPADAERVQAIDGLDGHCARLSMESKVSFRALRGPFHPFQIAARESCCSSFMDRLLNQAYISNTPRSSTASSEQITAWDPW